MLRPAALALRRVAGEQDDDGVEVGAGEPADPVVGMVRAGVAEHLRAGHHALPELLGKRGERGLVHAERPQAVPGEGHRHPALARGDRCLDLGGRLHLVEDARRARPVPPARSRKVRNS